MGVTPRSEVLADAIDRTSWFDTHEHLVEEHERLLPDGFRWAEPDGIEGCIPADWSLLLSHYPLTDLISAGLPLDAARTLLSGRLAPLEQWDLVAPQLEASRTTGYLRAVELTTQRLLDLPLARDTVEEIDARLRALRKPGYYAHVLREVANIDRCQVNSLVEDPICETATPELLEQDLHVSELVTGRHEAVELRSGIEVARLDDYLDVIDWCFEQYGPQAVAVKCAWAYDRPMAVQEVDASPRAAFARVRRGDASLGDRRCVEDFLFHRCVDLATERDLPVKVHLGYLSGNGLPQFPWIYDHVAAAARIVQAHPRARFILMHIAWPQQEQLLALAKHQPNVWVDLCWAWILAPLATGDFVERFLTSVPANKLLCFGGDYAIVEAVVGHAELARRGLQDALERLVARGWLSGEQALTLVPRLMRGNAEALFPEREKTLRP
jgi:uncharacterized protein